MKKSLLALIAVLTMLVPSTALADSSSCQAYQTTTCTTSNTTTTTTSQAPTSSTPTSPAPTTSTAETGVTTASPGTTSATTASGTLPFTGLDLVALLGGATVLLGGGLIVRHLSRDQQN